MDLLQSAYNILGKLAVFDKWGAKSCLTYLKAPNNDQKLCLRQQDFVNEYNLSSANLPLRRNTNTSYDLLLRHKSTNGENKSVLMRGPYSVRDRDMENRYWVHFPHASQDRRLEWNPRPSLDSTHSRRATT